MGATSGPGAVVSMVKAGGWLRSPPPGASRHRPAMQRKGAPFKVKRCLAFGYFLPVNSKNAEAGIRQRLLLSKRLPSERKLNTGPPRLDGGKLNFIGTSLMPLSAARITGPT